MANGRIGEPRRHATLVDHFANRFTPAHGVVVAGQRKRTDLAGAMALDAAILKQPRDLIGVGHFAVGRLWLAADEAAHGLHLGLAHFLAGQEFVDGNGQSVIKSRFASEEVSVDFSDPTMAMMNPNHAYGTVEDCIGYVQRLIDAGADEILFICQMGTVPQWAQLETLKNIGEKVIPHFRKG